MCAQEPLVNRFENYLLANYCLFARILNHSKIILTLKRKDFLNLRPFLPAAVRWTISHMIYSEAPGPRKDHDGPMVPATKGSLNFPSIFLIDFKKRRDLPLNLQHLCYLKRRPREGGCKDDTCHARRYCLFAVRRLCNPSNFTGSGCARFRSFSFQYVYPYGSLKWTWSFWNPGQADSASPEETRRQA